MKFSPKLAIFDLDGTLLHFPYHHFLRRSREVLAEMGIGKVSDEKIRSAFERFEFAGLFDHPGRSSRREEFWQRFKEQPAPPSEVIEGVRNLLTELTELNIPLAVATARDTGEEAVADELAKHDLLRFVSAIATRTDYSRCWTDKSETIRIVCGKLNHSPENTVMFGDTPSDVKSSRSAGIKKVCAVLSGRIHPGVLRAAAPDYLLDNVAAAEVLPDGHLSFHRCRLHERK